MYSIHCQPSPSPPTPTGKHLQMTNVLKIVVFAFGKIESIEHKEKAGDQYFILFPQ